MGALLSPTSDNFVQKTLGAQLLAGATTVTLNNTTNIPNLPGAFIVDRIDTNSVETPSTREVITYTGVSGSTLTGLARNADGSGSDQAHAINAIVEFGPDVLWAQSVYDAITKVVVASTGLLDPTKVVDLATAQTLTTKTLTSPTLATPIITGDMNIPTSGNIQPNGVDPTRGMYLPASSMTAATTNGAATGTIETSTNKVIVPVFDFDTTTQEFTAVAIPTPTWWDAGTVTVQFIWTAASGSGGVVWAAQGLCTSDDDPLDTAYGTEQIIADTLIAAVDDHHTSFTPAITIAGTPVAGDMVFLRFKRTPANASDTLAVDARLIGVKVRFGMGQYNDA